MMYLEEPGLIVRAQARIADKELEILPRLHRLGASTVTPTFQQFSYANTELLAERLALRSGVLALCRKRGFRGLIDLPVPKMAAGANLSMIYAEAFETPQETEARWSQDCQGCGETMLPKQLINRFLDGGHYSLLRTTEAFNAAPCRHGSDCPPILIALSRIAPQVDAW